jgi:hypothetical protein
VFALFIRLRPIKRVRSSDYYVEEKARAVRLRTLFGGNEELKRPRETYYEGLYK